MGTDFRPVLLDVDAVHVHHGSIAALRGVSLNVREGEVLSIIGSNGAGKSTLLKAIAGLLPLSGGSIRYCGEALHDQPPHLRVRRGIALVPEGRGLFASLSVADNLRLGAYSRHNAAAVASDLEQVLSLLPRLRERLTQSAGTLSGGEQQMLAIGRALLARPRLLLLDEPSMGLAPRLVDDIFASIAEIARNGVSIVLVEQNARRAMSLSMRTCVLASGEVAMQGESAQLRDDPAVAAAYLGGL